MIKKFLYNFDLFPAVPGFRVRGEAEVLSICGGIFSLALIAFFFYIFLDGAIKILDFKKI